MVLKYQLSPYPTLMEDILIQVWEAASDDPAPPVYETTIPEDGGGGHPNIATVIANGLDTVVHILRAYGATSGNLLHFYNAEPKAEIVTVFDPIRFKIGDDGEFTPGAGDNEYINPILHGQEINDYLLMRNNQGLLFPDLHYFVDPVNDKFSLAAPDVFSPADEFTLMLNPKSISTVVNDSVVGKWFGGFVDINADTDFIAAHLRKLMRFTNTCAYSFTVGTPPLKNYGYCFNNYGAGSVGTIKFLNAPLIFAGVELTEIVLPNKCEACFSFDGAKWNVVYLINSTSFSGAPPTPPSNTILGSGDYNIGDVPAGDPVYTVTHNLDIAGDYRVWLSIKSNSEALYFRNNKVGSTWWHMEDGTKKDRFRFSVQEIAGEAQQLSVTWLIVKA